MNYREEQADKTGSYTSNQDPNPCPICLAPLVKESYLDACFRRFLSLSLFLCVCVCVYLWEIEFWIFFCLFMGAELIKLWFGLGFTS